MFCVLRFADGNLLNGRVALAAGGVCRARKRKAPRADKATRGDV